MRARDALITLSVLATSGNSWNLGNDFTLSITQDQLHIARDNLSIWSTSTAKPFISASAGNDSVVGSNGAFQITQVDVDKCQGQNITSIEQVAWDDTSTGSATRISGHLLECGSASAAYALALWVPSDLDDRVAFYLDVSPSTNAAQPLKKLYFSFASSASEDFYGLGAQPSFASLKNQSIPIITREQGVGRGDEPITSIENANGSFAGGDFYTSYTAVPSYITTDARLFYLSEKSTAYANFTFARDEVIIRYDSLSVDGAFTRTENLFDAIEALTAYSGRMPPLPKWVDEGAILGIQGGQDKVNRIVEQGLNLSTPIAAVWLQDWCGTHSQEAPYVNISRLWWNWENDEVLYPTWNQFVQDLRDKHNVRTLSYINPFLTNVSTKTTGYRRNLYNEASEAHYFIQNTTTNSTAIISSGPGLNAGVLDLTNPQTRAWFTDILRTQVWNANISGFMTDFGEYTPLTNDIQIHNTNSPHHDAFFYHNAYPTQWSHLHRDIIESLHLQPEALTFHRSASQRSSHAQNLFWTGDQNVNWALHDGIKSVLTIMLHMSFSGFAQQHSDIGGYTTILTDQGYNITRSPELLGRWGELAALSSVCFRSHEGNIPSVNAQFYSNLSTYTYFAHNARMFVALAPYRRFVLEEECETRGWPLLRGLVMYHPRDRRARGVSWQSFYLGGHLYVAPVLEMGRGEVEVYLPDGDDGRRRMYEHVWTGEVFEGGRDVVVAAPFGKPAVFLVNDARGNVPQLRPFLEFVERERGRVIRVD